MDKIQTSILAVLGLSGALAFLVPSAATGPQEAGNEPVEAADETNGNVAEEPEQDAESESDDSDWYDDSDASDASAPAFGEPMAIPETSADYGKSSENRSEISEETDDQVEDISPSPVDQPPPGEGSPSPAILSKSGLKNGSGGSIEVTSEQIRDSKSF